MAKRKESLVQNESTKDDAPIQDVPLACADEKAAVEFFEKQRWGDTPCCPHCGSLSVYQMKATTGERQANFRWRCHDCKQQYTVRVGTVFEDSRIPMRHWALGFFRASTSKKGVSALEIHRQTGLSYKSALFMLHRIRLAMDAQDIEPLNGIVEVDEVFIGGKPRRIQGTRQTIKKDKAIVVGLKERGGRVRPKVVADVTAKTLKSVIEGNVKHGSRIMTDDWSGYRGLTKAGWNHESVTHSSPTFEYARGDVTTNSIEGFFGMLKRGLHGIYHSVSKKHLHRYLSEFEFRHDNGQLSDGQRMVKAIRSANNKHITYRQLVDGQ